jgi:hypothetical protein
MTDATDVVVKPKIKPPNAGKGRVKGIPNKATSNAREAISRFVDGNAELLQELLEEIRDKDGAKAAWDCIVSVLEYHIPKLARTEHTGEGGGPLVIQAARDDETL